MNDGDIVQLGIDFKGGEEMIFRCVKIRVELNKGWQTGPSSFKYVLQLHVMARLTSFTVFSRINDYGNSTTLVKQQAAPRKIARSA